MEYVFEPRWSGQEQDSSAPSEPQPAERSLTQNMMSLLLNTLSDSVDYQEIGTGEAAAPDDARHRPFGVRRDGRGALVFSADFEDGNIDTVDMSPDGMEYEINLRHDSLNPK